MLAALVVAEGASHPSLTEQAALVSTSSYRAPHTTHEVGQKARERKKEKADRASMEEKRRNQKEHLDRLSDGEKKANEGTRCDARSLDLGDWSDIS